MTWRERQRQNEEYVVTVGEATEKLTWQPCHACPPFRLVCPPRSLQPLASFGVTLQLPNVALLQQ